MAVIDQAYIQDKFIEYCKVNTRSDDQSKEVPTTPGQIELLKIIEQELENLGLENISFFKKDSYLVGKLPGTVSFGAGSVCYKFQCRKCSAASTSRLQWKRYCIKRRSSFVHK